MATIPTPGESDLFVHCGPCVWIINHKLLKQFPTYVKQDAAYHKLNQKKRKKGDDNFKEPLNNILLHNPMRKYGPLITNGG